jgi:hypothetical protein
MTIFDFTKLLEYNGLTSKHEIHIDPLSYYKLKSLRALELIIVNGHTFEIKPIKTNDT